MAKVNIMLQGKGGVGKSVVSSLLAQKAQSNGKSLDAHDTDPVNATFSNYKGLKVGFVDIVKDGEVDPSLFDKLMEDIINSKSEEIVIDNGASCFLPLSQYIEATGAIEILKEMGHEVFIHTIVTGGQALKDTLAGLDQLCTLLGDSGAKIVVWKNEFWGAIEDQGKSFEEMAVYKKHKKAIHSVVTIPELNPKKLFQDVFSEMLKKKMTFSEARESSEFDVLKKSRLHRIEKQLFEAMDIAV